MVIVVRRSQPSFHAHDKLTDSLFAWGSSPPPFLQAAVPHNFFPAPGQVGKIGKSRILQHEATRNPLPRFSETTFRRFFSPHARCEKKLGRFFETLTHKKTSPWVRAGVPWANYSQGILK
jgi:hypothetical protein